MKNFTLIVKPEGERAFRTTLRALAKANRDDPGLARRASRLKPGKGFCEGGGAAVAYCISRPKRRHPRR